MAGTSAATLPMRSWNDRSRGSRPARCSEVSLRCARAGSQACGAKAEVSGLNQLRAVTMPRTMVDAVTIDWRSLRPATYSFTWARWAELGAPPSVKMST